MEKPICSILGNVLTSKVMFDCRYIKGRVLEGRKQYLIYLAYPNKYVLYKSILVANFQVKRIFDNETQWKVIMHVKQMNDSISWNWNQKWDMRLKRSQKGCDNNMKVLRLSFSLISYLFRYNLQSWLLYFWNHYQLYLSR